MPSKRSPASLAERALALHKKLGGKLEVQPRAKLTRESLELLYTPGVGAVSDFVARNPHLAPVYTSAARTVAVVSDGSAVLGLGNIGPIGALPVMEGKALLFKALAGADAVPIVLSSQDPDDIVNAVKTIAPSFGAINLEDIAAPKCFDIEDRLKEELAIPVVHDDQHATAIVVLAGLINAHKVVKKSLTRSRIAIIGAGAAGTAVAKLLLRYGVGDVVVVDRHGILSSLRTDINCEKQVLAEITNREQRTGGVLEALAGADAVVGVSAPGLLQEKFIRLMAQRPIVFALANPVPEIMPDEAKAAGAAVVATGRSDFPNQINNVLVFPGLFKGVLDHHVQRVTDDMKVRAAKKLASVVARPTANKIVPTIFDRRVVPAIRSAIH